MTDPTRGRFTAALLSGIDAMEAQQTGSLRSLWRAALRLEHVILSDLLTAEEEREVLAGLAPARKEVCQDIFCRLETSIENSFASLTLGGGEDVVRGRDSISENYLCRYEELARREIDLAGITSRDRALFIGSGPFPITAIEYCRQTGCSVDCVDYVPEAVRTSRAVMERLELTGRIHCHQARGEHVAAGAYSVVLVGVLAQPKQEILANLQATCADGCRIMTRTTFGLRELIYRPAAPKLASQEGLRALGVNEARGDQVLSAVLYRKGP